MGTAAPAQWRTSSCAHCDSRAQTFRLDVHARSRRGDGRHDVSTASWALGQASSVLHHDVAVANGDGNDGGGGVARVEFTVRLV